ncbi:chemotaxis-specific protein-glutamate methyltransferase CheB [Actimicrobium sp. CCC2.4]|uniref:chemotaxis-specific protein-glutamate methyltransferase CheB n=1 Tax=Actimicrobium sp. CCC2.4 TaxID=3048606 RepID=UPI002AC8B513|nr:chemotaxis-specific protein-glutamate methyltransferase CheB [Actimicrobium sp. CCC2.4]MEB0133716.1 chemotaxis-specific protein-glutamate methyltransferase CheB [Actimicrobium sp. CCC2.4]WPX31263.1 chemotaxis-specific protein-glutamate methyltransferase CheB [Actimicrobium sp. CCC2.4]
MIKLLIVDDSALMRRQLSSLFEAEQDFTIRLARNGKEAVAENLAFEPDVVTLDINMPEMDGLTALSLMMAGRPVPIVMISSLTEKGALATFEALNLGAVDYIVKPGGTISLSIDAIRDAVVNKVRTAARARMRLPRKAIEKAPPPLKATVAPVSKVGEGIVMIGVSTGGPSTLELVLPHLPAHFPYPVLVAQHMPASFTLSFAQRMNTLCAMQVVEVSRPMTLEAGTVYIAKGGADLQVVRRVGKLTAIARPESSEHLWHPSVDLMARSALEQLDAKQVMAVMLTGMGNDGAAAFTEVKRQGGRTIAESRESAVVFGMPAELIRLGGASVTLPAEKIARQLNAWLGC